MPSSYDFAILGAGIAGVSAAYFLSKTAKVALIEREDSWGYHASGRSAAVFIEGYENPTVSKLTQDSKDFFVEATDNFSDYPVVKPLGGLTVVPTDQTDQAHAFLDRWQSLNPCLAFIEQSDALNRIPILRAEGLAGAIWDPNLLSIDTHQLMQGLLRAFFSNGGELLCGKTATLQRRARRDWAIDAHGLAVKTPIVINAAGAWANEVALMADQAPLPLVPNRRTAAVIKMEHGAPDWPMLRTMDQQLYVKPEEPGLMLSPQDETPSKAMDAQPDELDLAIAMDRFHKLCDFDVSTIHRSWAGLRTLTPDRCPAVGFSNTDKDFFWLAGQGGAGIQTAPAIGRMTADILIAGAPVNAQLDPRRFASSESAHA